MPTRRQTTIGLLSAALGSAAVSSASLTSNVEPGADMRIVVASDLRMIPERDADDNYVREDANGEVEAIQIDQLNQYAATYFERLIRVENNGTVAFDRIAFEFEVSASTSETETQMAETLAIVSADAALGTDDAGRTVLPAGERLEPGGEGVTFGIAVNLIPSSEPGTLSDLPDEEFEITLRVDPIPE